MRKTLLNIGNSYLFTGIVVAIDKDFGYEVLDDEWSADDGTQPHAVTGVENEDYVIASSAQTVAYNPWGKVSGISEGAYTEELLYGPDGQRWKTVDRHNGQLTGLHYPHLDYEWRSDGGTLRQFHYHYYLKDHLGSVRVVLDGDGTVEQVNDYYPSGTLMYTSTNGTVQPYKFGQKELERTLPLDDKWWNAYNNQRK